MQIRLKKLHPDAVLPHYAHGPLEDAGMDLRAVERALAQWPKQEAMPITSGWIHSETLAMP